jgi:hypothetical protein
MATMYIKDKLGRWNKIDVGRTEHVVIHFDYGGCTGHTMSIDMDELWCADISASDKFTVGLCECITTDIGGVKIDGEDVE